MVIRLRVVQVMVDNEEETAIAVYRVSGGVDTCRVGFTRRHLLKYKDEYDARLAQITEIFSEKSESPSDRAKHHRMKGCCRAVLIEAEYRETPQKKRPREEGPNNLE